MCTENFYAYAFSLFTHIFRHLKYVMKFLLLHLNLTDNDFIEFNNVDGTMMK